jgi:hypothetical protein
MFDRRDEFLIEIRLKEESIRSKKEWEWLSYIIILPLTLDASLALRPAVNGGVIYLKHDYMLSEV